MIPRAWTWRRGRAPLACSLLAASASLCAPLGAQCQFSGIAVLPHGSACTHAWNAQVFATWSSSACAVDILFLSYMPTWSPNGGWIALGTAPQLAIYPQLAFACPQLQNPTVILPMGFQQRIPIPPGLPPLTFYVTAIGLHYEPNAAAWFLAPPRQILQVTLQ